MKEFVLLYKGGDPDWLENSQDVIASSMAAWGEWMGALKAKDQLVSGGSPLNYSGKRVNAKGVVTDIAASELKEIVSGYSVIKAKDFDEAAAIAAKCPVLLHSNTIVEVREVTQM